MYVPLSEHFLIEYGTSLALNKLTMSDGDSGIAFVSRTAKNNGVSAWVEKLPATPPLPAGLLTVSLRSRNHALATFVQPRDFYTGFHVFVLRPRHAMSINEKIWWAQCIEHNRYRYNFGRQANRSLADLLVPNSAPEWVSLVVPPRLTSTSTEDLADLNQVPWSKISLTDVFDIKRGSGGTTRDLREGATPFVSAIAHSNGISARVDRLAAHPAGSISVVSNGNGGMGFAFYQPEAFVASGDVSVLEPHEPLTVGAALFICTVIKNERYRWHFNRKWTTSRLKDSGIYLPVDGNGKPYWALMEKYMRSLPLADLALE
ncbi:restriction endonuclease subunit S [Catenuloplanes atrovinosus]|uniref:Type I restriction modification DNA specificity domain-containing protein n=1 Tax=Catenuloplanes atrovinosus TaxID=137266 RepID=A0AAE4CD67_9ACTN|nr:restriction endonuclease subunit S [Catenuloplanes atrovinosus]MDR7279898.1 hypothetical protein [Catenuloplanes atrovinosus]